ncbi:MAG: hypothetical protein Hens3KO_12470 [Henriciella sp.]
MMGGNTYSNLPKRTQASCCYLSSTDMDATFCGECGKPILRCIAAEECGGLLDDQGLCTVCVDPHIQVDAGALTAVKVGGAVSLPLTIANVSVVGRPLFVTKLWSREAGGEWREEALGWERLNAGQSRPVNITANQFDRAGAHSLDVLVAVANRWRWRQECYAFSATLRLTIEGEATQNGPVVTIGGDSAGHGNTVYISGQKDDAIGYKMTTDALDLPMVRSEKEERRLELRGISATHWVPRNARLNWHGFPELETPMDGPILTADGLLAVGRTRSRRAGGLGDIRLLAERPDGTVDEEMSRLISRRHFELYIECNRLMLRVNSSAGLRINGEAYGPDKTIALADGDKIEPLVKTAGNLAVLVGFKDEHGSINTISMTRLPRSQRGD